LPGLVESLSHLGGNPSDFSVMLSDLTSKELGDCRSRRLNGCEDADSHRLVGFDLFGFFNDTFSCR